MRKYRGKVEHTGEWCLGMPVEVEGTSSITMVTNIDEEDFVCRVIDKETLGQEIGIKDNNNKEIFKGDIVCFHHDGENRLYEIVYLAEKDYPAYDLAPYDSEMNGISEANAIGYLTVVGDVHDNKELVELLGQEVFICVECDKFFAVGLQCENEDGDDICQDCFAKR